MLKRQRAPTDITSALTCHDKFSAHIKGHRLYVPSKPCTHGHRDGYLTREGKCLTCYTRKHRRLKLAAQHRNVVARIRAEIKACWFEIMLMVLIRHREALLWRLRKLLKHRASALRDREYNRSRKRGPQAAVQRKAHRARHHAAVRRKEREHEHVRRARTLEAGGRFTAKDVETLLWRQQHRCYWCALKLTPGYHVDHVWPLSKGGTNGPENICLACPTCNLTKHNKTPQEFAGRLL